MLTVYCLIRKVIDSLPTVERLTATSASGIPDTKSTETSRKLSYFEIFRELGKWRSVSAGLGTTGTL